MPESALVVPWEVKQVAGNTGRAQAGQALIIVMVLVGVFLLLGTATVSLGSSGTRAALYEGDLVRALYIAEAGVEKTLARAKWDYSWVEGLVVGAERNLVTDPIPSGYGGGTLEYVKVTKVSSDENKSTLRIESRGRYRHARRTVRVTVEVARPFAFWRGVWTESPDSAPSSFSNNATVDSEVLVNGSITFSNNCTITEVVRVGGNVVVENNMEINPRDLYAGGTVTIKNNGEVAGNVHAVGSVLLENNAEVGGDVRSMGDVTLENNAEVGGGVWANGNVNLASNAKVKGGVYPHQSMDLRFTVPDFPYLDLEWYRQNAEHYLSGPQTWTGSVSLDGLYFIDGNLTVQGTCTYRGLATVVVNGTVTVSNNGKLLPADPARDDLCLLGSGNVNLLNNVEVKALVYSPATVSIENNAVLRGSVIARTLSVQNNAEVIYEPELVDNQPDWVTAWVRIISWQELYPIFPSSEGG